MMGAPVKTEPLNDDPIPMDSDSVQLDDDDEIIEEIDVYLSPSLAPQFHLIQFPLQHGSVSLPQAARIKPRHGMLELDQGIPATHERSYLPDEINLSHRTHTSHTIPISTHMALGKMEISSVTQKKALHLIPLSHISQMRPDFSHIDEASGDSLLPEEEEEPKKLEKKPVMFQKKESERAALARQSSYAYKKASEEGEEWQFLAVHGPGTPTHGRVLQSVVCPSSHEQNTTSSIHTSPPTNDESVSYVHSLNYVTAGSGTGASAMEETDFRNGDVTLLCGKLTSFMHRGWPIPFSVLRARVPSIVSDYSLLEALSSCAVFLRGNFVLQSRLLALPVPIQHARTFILYLIQSFGYIERSRLDHVFNGDTVVTPEVILMLLQQVAEKCQNGWRSKVEDDLSVCAAFPEQAQLQLQYWEQQRPRFDGQVQKYQQAEEC